MTTTPPENPKTADPDVPTLTIKGCWIVSERSNRVHRIRLDQIIRIDAIEFRDTWAIDFYLTNGGSIRWTFDTAESARDTAEVIASEVNLWLDA